MIGVGGANQVLLKDFKLWSHISKLQKKEKQNGIELVILFHMKIP